MNTHEKQLVKVRELPSVLRELDKKRELSLDTETTGLRWFDNDRITAIIIADEDREYYFNFKQTPEHEALEWHMFYHYAEPMFLNSKITWFMHNAKFDLHMLATEGILVVGKVHDTMVVERLLESDALSLSLKNVAVKYGVAKSDAVQEWLDENHAWEWREIPGKKKREKHYFWDRVPVDILLPYGCQDARITYQIGKRQQRAIEEIDATQYVDGKRIPNPFVRVVSNELQLVKTVFHMEEYGVRVDVPYCEEARAYYTAKVYMLTDRFKRETGHAFTDSAKAFKVSVPDLVPDKVSAKTGALSYEYDVLAAIDHPMAKLILDIRDAKKCLDFFNTFLYYKSTHNTIHASFNQAGAKTGRFSCVARGTLVDVVRDISKEPRGRFIEDVRAGDLVYCYDDALRLKIRRVLWAGKTGTKKVLRLHWLGQGRRKRGYLDVTPDHLIRLSSGEYVPASELEVGASLLSLGRSKTLGYSRLHTRDTEIREHRLIFEQVHGYLPEHVHHCDGNKLNNSVENLEGLTAAEHVSTHAREIMNTPESRVRNAEQAKQQWANGTFKVRSGEENGNFIKANRFSLLRALACAAGRPTRCKSIIKDFNTLKKKCVDTDISITGVAKRYGKDGRFISRGRLQRSSVMPLTERLDYLRIGHRRYKELLSHYRLPTHPKRNHKLVAIEEVGTVDVYDLEVEDFHNFIANEICVHNCSDPNLQQLTKTEVAAEGEEVYPVRRAFVPRPGCFLLMVDYDQQEYRMMVDLCGDAKMLKKIIGGMDVHTATVESVAPVRAITRADAKGVNFAILYGAGNDKLGATLKITHHEARKIRTAVFEAIPNLSYFLNAVQSRARTNGHIKNWLGRITRFPKPFFNTKDELKEFYYRAPNSLIQGGCADVVKVAMNECDARLVNTNTRMLMCVHDELVFEVKYGEEHLVPELIKIMEGVYKPRNKLHLTVSAKWSPRSLADGEPVDYEKIKKAAYESGLEIAKDISTNP